MKAFAKYIIVLFVLAVSSGSLHAQNYPDHAMPPGNTVPPSEVFRFQEPASGSGIDPDNPDDELPPDPNKPSIPLGNGTVVLLILSSIYFVCVNRKKKRQPQ